MRVPAWKADTPVVEQRLLDAALAELLDSYFGAVAQPLGRRYKAMREAWASAGGASPKSFRNGSFRRRSVFSSTVRVTVTMVGPCDVDPI